MSAPPPNSTRIALVTGANRGLGRAEALALAADGLDLILTYRTNRAEADAVAREVEALGRRARTLMVDLEDLGSLSGFADRVRAVLQETWQRGTFDVLVNNAGFVLPTPIGGTGVALARQMVDVHFTGPVLLIGELIPLLADGGRVVTTGSALTRALGVSEHSLSASAKAVSRPTPATLPRN